MSPHTHITEQDILDAQRAWGDGIVAIGEAHTSGGDARGRAREHLDALYAFANGPVLFKPTKAAEAPFRNDYASALSYFVAGDEAQVEDHGFALQPWTAVRFENAGVLMLTHGEGALAMGHYFFTDTAGAETQVEYSFAYLQDASGRLRIHLHHSSLPYEPSAP
jgi:hypothetical protein